MTKKKRKVRAIIRQNPKNKMWYIHFRAANGEPLPDNYKRMSTAIHGASLFNDGVEIIAYDKKGRVDLTKKKKAVKKRKK